ncbi:MAG: rhodanese-like domain-containing protein, partial [Desulfuromonadales bacterium]|nr:rhodanese-like domain-containing protein [Desulfuromonadales bacterium]
MKQIIQITILLLLLPLVVHAAKWQQITPQQVYNLMEEGSGLWLIDVRETQAFEQTHIEGSVNISPAALATKTFPAKKKLVVTDNALGQLQAQQAAEVLVKNGQKRVYVLSGGVVAWEQAKLPMVGDGLKWPLRQVMA